MLNMVNIGCGQSPTKDWLNFDNSFSIKIAKNWVLFTILKTLGLLKAKQLSNIQFAKKHNIQWANAEKRIWTAPLT